MATVRSPKHGSLQYWPRVKAKRIYPRIRHYSPAVADDGKLGGFAGYKVGMTHIILVDPKAHTLTKGEEISCPVTIVECPPLKVMGIRAYKKMYKGMSAVADVVVKGDKELERKIDPVKKAQKITIDDMEKSIANYDTIRVIVYTQPKLTGFNKVKPDLFELPIGGKNIQEKFNYAKQILGKEVKVDEVFREGQQVDIHAVTKGKGFQGPVKRFGVALRQHKAEKTKRGPGTLGAWTGPRTWTVAHAGQMGYHTRMEHNKWIVKISQKPEEINGGAGFKRYGIVRTTYILLKGSVAGPAKRMIRMINPIRKDRKVPEVAPVITYVSK